MTNMEMHLSHLMTVMPTDIVQETDHLVQGIGITKGVNIEKEVHVNKIEVDHHHIEGIRIENVSEAGTPENINQEMMAQIKAGLVNKISSFKSKLRIRIDSQMPFQMNSKNQSQRKITMQQISEI